MLLTAVLTGFWEVKFYCQPSCHYKSVAQSSNGFAIFFVIASKNSMKRYLLLLFLAPALFACSKKSISSTVDKKVDAETPFVIAYHQQLNIQPGKDEPFTIRFDEKHDSRCPIGFECVWAGTAKIDVSINNKSYNLEINIPSYFVANGKDYTITLVKLDPYPDHGYPEASLYKATLSIQ